MFSKVLLNLSILLLLAGCQSVSNNTQKDETPEQLQSFPYDAKLIGKDIVDLQLALKDRNLYMSSEGRVKLFSTGQCNIDIVAHRGDFREPESSERAITSATADDFNTIEIDVMQIKSGLWVNHHDMATGRAVVHYSGKSYNLAKMSDKTFSGLRLRDKETNSLLEQRPITAYESFTAFAKAHKPGQILNVEVKSQANGAELTQLDHMLRKTIGQNSFYYSSLNLETLKKLRGINTTVYLGFIQAPHPDSIAKLKRELRKGVKKDELYQRHSRNIEALGNYGTRRYSQTYKDYTSLSALSNLQIKLGSNSGLHMDIRSYAKATSVKGRSNRLGMKVYSYSINGTDYHQGKLLALNKSLLPDGIIIDATPYRLCQQLFNASKPLKLHKPNTSIGRYIKGLPQDADFDKFEQMLSYIDEGYYVSMAEGLKRIGADKNKSVFKPNEDKKPIGLSLDFPTIKDEKMDTSTGKAIRITIPSVEQ
ncbi:glycerophosphodiester phosphodiesterase [Colwellia sp. 75C3]|uniref:glycerophosphodiester phosphodiesterase n=1 Tax=Colwellia sp. 75C3 TaxID=888425 RepID=UPI001E371F91|nr:glycerophosphodiester phosphodiesterase family protein [Colwellia sp. 75C3]